jgi:hypothetical protein
LSQEIDLHIAFERGIMCLAAIHHLSSSSPCAEDQFRRVLGRVRRDADIAAHYARRYLESGGSMPQRSFFEECELLLRESEEARADSGAISELTTEEKTTQPRSGQKLLAYHDAKRHDRLPAVVPPESPLSNQSLETEEELAEAVLLVTQGLKMFRWEQERRRALHPPFKSAG